MNKPATLRSLDCEVMPRQRQLRRRARGGRRAGRRSGGNICGAIWCRRPPGGARRPAPCARAAPARSGSAPLAVARRRGRGRAWDTGARAARCPPTQRARTRGSGRVRGRARSRVLLLVQSAGSPERQRVLVSWVLWRCVCAEERGALCLEQNVWTKVRAKHYHALG